MDEHTHITWDPFLFSEVERVPEKKSVKLLNKLINKSIENLAQYFEQEAITWRKPPLIEWFCGRRTRHLPWHDFSHHYLWLLKSVMQFSWGNNGTKSTQGQTPVLFFAINLCRTFKSLSCSWAVLLPCFFQGLRKKKYIRPFNLHLCQRPELVIYFLVNSHIRKVVFLWD